MIVNDITVPENYKLKKIMNILNNQYGIDIKFIDTTVLKDSYDSYKEIKDKIIQESNFNSYHSNQEYVKATLIMEAIQIYLVEIAPKRVRKVRR